MQSDLLLSLLDLVQDCTGKNNLLLSLSLIFISMIFNVLFPCILIYYYYRYSCSPAMESEKKQEKFLVLSATNSIRNPNDLPKLKPFKPSTTTIYLYQAQSQLRLRQFIHEAKRIQLVTMVSAPNFGILEHNAMYLHIELVQETRTLIGIVEYFDRTDRFTPYSNILRELFSMIFTESKTVQT